MSFQITTGFVNEYTSVVQMLVQQTDNRLTAAVMTGSHTGEGAVPVEQVGRRKMRKKTERHGDTKQTDTPHDRRWVYPEDFVDTDFIDNEDKLRTLADFQSPYAQAQAAAARREQDNSILTAFYGTSRTGKQGEVSIVFPSANIVAANFGASGSVGMTVSKLIEGKRLLEAAEVDIVNDPIFAILTAKQNADLLNETKATNHQFNSVPVLEKGRITEFLGIRFIHVEYGNASVFDVATTSISGTVRKVPMWAKSGMHFGLWKPIHSRIDPRPDKDYTTQIWTGGTWGATRLEEAKVVQILSDEA